MSQVKEAVIEMIKEMPADIMAELYFRQKVDRGLKELDEGKGITHKVVRERMKKWLK